MTKPLKYLLLFNAGVEALVGGLFLLAPSRLAALPGLEAFQWEAPSVLPLALGMYGLAALSLGWFSALLAFRNSGYHDGVALFILFHLGLCAVLFFYAFDWRAGVYHGMMGLAFLLLLLRPNLLVSK